MLNQKKEPLHRILVIKLGALGDFIQSLGPMAAIRRNHPEAEITLLTTKPFKKIAEDCGYFNHIWIDERPKWTQLKSWIDLKNRLNSGDFERVYDLQNNDRTSIYLKLFKPKPQWVGAAKGASHRNTSKERTSSLAYFGHVQTLALAGIHDVEIDTLEWMDSDISKFSLPSTYALIMPGSAPSRPEKRWSPDNFISICNNLIEKNIQPVLIGTKAEEGINALIQKQCPKALNLTEKTTLNDLPALARHSLLCLGNDTGPMHIAAPTGTKTFVLFTKHSNPKRHAPLGKNVSVLKQEEETPTSVKEKIFEKLAF